MLVTPETREALITRLLETPKGRATLAAATFNPAQNMLDLWESAKTRGTPLDPSDIVSVMDRIVDALDGTEPPFDKVRFSSLRSDLKSLLAR